MKSGVLVVGHGSKMVHNKELVEQMAKTLDQRGEFGPVEAGFMQISEPDIPTGLKNVVGRGAETVYVVPCFLATGIHTTEDIPGVLGLDKGVYRGNMMVDGKKIDIRYCQPMGQDLRLADILTDRIKAEM